MQISELEFEFLQHSNWIEDERRPEAMEDAIKAWEYILGEDTMTTSKLLTVHRILMQRLNVRIAGYFRECPVWVGGREGADWRKVAVLTQKWIEDVNFMNQNAIAHDKAVKYPEEMDMLSRMQHVGFEKIHPFEDGNGRTGRILMNWQRVKVGLPILVIHEGDEQLEYYQWFR